MREISKTFCVLPWTHLATYTDGSVLLCCVAKNNLGINLNSMSLNEAWNSEPIRMARKKMLKGEKVDSCEHCYIEENNGCRSHRLAENLAWPDRFGEEFLYERIHQTNRHGHLDSGLVALDLRLGNSCNLQCVMCRPQDSSKWQATAKKLSSLLDDSALRSEWDYKSQVDLSKFEWYQRLEFWEDLKSFLPNIRELILGGGEPMLLKEHRQLLELCVRSGEASHIQIRYHTNGTVLPDDIFELWKSFKLVEVYVSVDSLENMNHYMRYPAVWENITANLKSLDQYAGENLKVRLLCSIHALNAYYLSDYAQWVENQNFKRVTRGYNGYYHPGFVHYPPYLSVQVYPKELKRLTAERITRFERISKRPSSRVPGILNLMNGKDTSGLLPKTRDYLRKLDLIRGTHFGSTFPELNEHIRVY